MLSEGRHASLSSSFSEIEFGRARPTSLLHSSIHLLIPSGEGRGGGEDEVQERAREGERDQMQREEKEKRGKWQRRREGGGKKKIESVWEQSFSL